MDTGPIPAPPAALPKAPPVRESPTAALVATIELMTHSTWTREQRIAVTELVRTYRFEQVGAVMLRVHNLVKREGNKELSEMIFMGKF